MKTAIIGQKKSIIAFEALGVKAFSAQNKKHLEQSIEQIMSSDYAILFLTEDVAEKFPQQTQQLCQQVSPAVLIIPGLKPGKQGQAQLEKIIERAIGTQVSNF